MSSPHVLLDDVDVFREGMIADNLYIVKKGLFVAQKDINIYLLIFYMCKCLFVF